MSYELELFQFRHSHYCEKVRWALQYKGLDYTPTYLLPGPHARIVRRLTGRTQTPVLRIESQYVDDSAWIVERLELIYKHAPKLFPVDEDTEAKAREIARHFDWIVGPAVRVCAFDAILEDPAYLAELFCGPQAGAGRALYRLALPLLTSRLRRANGMHARGAVARAQKFVESNMDALAQMTLRSRYLAGDAFSVADLTAASLIAPLIDPPQGEMQWPRPMPEKLAALTQRWRIHPAGRWALEMYDLHRSRSPAHAAVNGHAVSPS